MKIRKIKKLRMGSTDFDVIWDKNIDGASFSFATRKIVFGLKNTSQLELFMLICHEVWELVAVTMHVRLYRPDVEDDYIFVYDHRQHTAMTDLFAGAVAQFLGD